MILSTNQKSLSRSPDPLDQSEANYMIDQSGDNISPDPGDVLGLEEVGWHLGAAKPGPQLRRVVVSDRLLVVVNPGP